MASKQLTNWVTEFGDEYTTRNMPNEETLRHRMAFWVSTLAILPDLPISILEVGANVGANIHAIDTMYQTVGEKKPIMYFNEPNEKAGNILKEQHPDYVEVKGQAERLLVPDSHVGLVFTCGVLIHLSPDNLKKAMDEIYRVSSKYIICAEYFSPKLESIYYRGHDDMLWKGDYGSMYLDRFKLRCISYSFAWKRMTGMDNLTVWVFQKVN